MSDYAFVCEDCDPRPGREINTIGHPSPDLCDACGAIKETAELIGVGDIADDVTRGRALRGHEVRMDLLVKTEAIPGGPVAGFSGRRWKDTEPECSFRGITNLGRALNVQEGDCGARPCSGPRRTFLWSGQPGDHTYTVCATHQGEFSYWYRNATEVQP